MLGFMNSAPGEFSFTLETTYWGTHPHDFDRPSVTPGSILSRVSNQATGDVFVILTAQEVSNACRLRDYWTSVVLCAKEHSGFLRQHLKVYNMRFLEIARNNMADAHAVHQALKRIVKDEDVRRLKEFAPDPVPPEGLSAGALQALAEKGIAGERHLVEWEVRARWGFKNAVEEVKQYRRDAERGDLLSQFVLADRLAHGEDAAKDMVEAVKWYRIAAERSDAPSQHSLAWCLATGEGGKKDPVQAVEWYRKAAEQGLAASQYNLGNCYRLGEGVAPNKVEAAKWFWRAAEQGNPLAQCNLGWCLAHGEGVAKDAVQAAKWWQKSAQQGYALAQCNFGWCLSRGEGVTKDAVEAAKWYRKAAEQGNALAQLYLGEAYERGEGVPKDTSEAYKLFKLGAAAGVEAAAKNRARLELLQRPDF
jgi:TPR repeat protein